MGLLLIHALFVCLPVAAYRVEQEVHLEAMHIAPKH